MTRIALTGSAYQSRSLIAAAQRCVNLYPEPVPQGQGEPVPVIDLPTPGLDVLAVAGDVGPVRGLWLATGGQLFAVAGQTLYAVSSSWAMTALGTIPGSNPVGMADNTLTLVVVNGTSQGWQVDLGSLAFSAVSDSNFYGADRVDFIDTFLVFNKPGTPQMYCGPSNAVTPFDPLYFANITGAANLLQSLIVVHREIWAVGTVSTEPWFDAGAADFPFQIIPGAFIEMGTCAKYSLAKLGNTALWLSQDRYGSRYVVQSEGYQVKRASTFAIEEEFRKYSVVSDAIAWTYQQGGHEFYVLTFPTADTTWAYDKVTGLWHERAWIDANGIMHRHRAQCAVAAYGKIVCGDWQNGTLYALDPDAFTDGGNPIIRLRSFPHMVQDGDRVMYRQFIADMETGTATDATEPDISLRWSDDRGKTWGNPVILSIGRTGDYLLSIQAQRLGMARDRVFEVSWSAPVRTSLSGAFIEVTKAGS